VTVDLVSTCVQYNLIKRGWQDVVSLIEISLNIITGIINPLDFKTLRQIIPDRCVPTWGVGLKLSYADKIGGKDDGKQNIG
jgi:hypothetical protein